MKLFAVVAAALFPALALAQSIVSVSFDDFYNNSMTSLDTVACSEGINGLEAKGFKTFGDLPGFPNIGGAPQVLGFNSPECGTCWSLTFDGTTVNVTAIDTGAAGFNVARPALDALTGGMAVFIGRINATMTGPLPTASCVTNPEARHGRGF